MKLLGKSAISVLASSFFYTSALFDARAGAGKPWEERIASSTSSSAIKILFVGHSKMYLNNMPKMFAYIAQQKSAGQPLKIYSVSGDSYSLADHWQHGLAVNAIRNEGPWDYIVLFEASGLPEGIPAAYDKSVQAFAAEAAKAKARLVLVENYANTPAASAAIHRTMLGFGARYHAYILPIGTAWTIVSKKHPSISLCQSDNHHPNSKGSYLMSCVCYAFFLGRKPTDLPKQFYAVGQNEATENIFANDSEAQDIQSAAAEAVPQSR